MSDSLNLPILVTSLYDQFGPRKPMGGAATDMKQPHFFLIRRFLAEIDLAILLNTKRCRYQCSFCALPEKATTSWVPADAVIAQMAYVLQETRHAIGVIDRLTIGNEGSVLDATTCPFGAIESIVAGFAPPSLRRIVLESRLEFVDESAVAELARISKGREIEILCGFETLDRRIRREVLGKSESIEEIRRSLDILARFDFGITAYVLLKPDPEMSDANGVEEADRTISWLLDEAAERNMRFCVRLNPMYAATGTPWHARARQTKSYQPPRLTDAILLAEKFARIGVPVYLGLTSEGLAEELMTFRHREDFSRSLLKRAILWNRRPVPAVARM